MRVVRVERESSDHTLLWILSGALVGVVAGALLAERAGGRGLSGRSLLERARALLGRAVERGSELLEVARTLREEFDPDEGDDTDPDDESDAHEPTDDEDTEDLGARVLVAFEHDPILSRRAVEIESEASSILLHGRVHSSREVQHAVTIARGVPGVVEVRQRLRVRAGR